MKVQIQHQPVKLSAANLDRFNRTLAGVLECSTMNIIGVGNTAEKKIAVFILHYAYKVSAGRIAEAYSIAADAIATSVRQCMECAAVYPELGHIVHTVLNKMDGFIEAEGYEY